MDKAVIKVPDYLRINTSHFYKIGYSKKTYTYYIYNIIKRNTQGLVYHVHLCFVCLGENPNTQNINVLQEQG